ncbi:F-box/kelch-repeat protein At3g06240-like [Prunus avium]|uniref:F-box/kelch-repeat protein At3g06240-like n=1 Tax=Prunus avium TaxID=42229 RepID=A0A6P5RRC9_PRUAV|nr:F-box/kelch-repeat protein At3g06240-like [Prunus avium]
MGSYYEHDFIFCNLFGFTRADVRNGRSFVLVNPLKREVLMLPTKSDLQVPPNSFCNSDTFGMGFDNMTNTYKIVRVSRYLKEDRQTVVTAEVLVLGTSSWKELPSAPPCYPSCTVATSTHGAVHWLISGDDKLSVHILSFDFKNEEFYWTPHPLALKIKLDLSLFVHLLNFRGSLALVDVSSSDIEIWVLVLKNYDGKKKHEET